MRLILHVVHVVGVGLIAHIAVTQSGFRSREGVLHSGTDSVAAPGQVAFKFYTKSHAEVVVVFAVNDLIEHTGAVFAVAVLPQPGQLGVHVRTHMPGFVLPCLQIVQVFAA